MRIGSLFSGIGGLELGLEWAGVGHTVWQVERDPFCRAVLARHWPDAERFEDVCTVGVANLAPVDVICGGFPCQDISYAGKGAGLDGARSGLWFEFARIVREMGPRFVVVENVSALLTRGLDAVLGTLASLGYDAEWCCVRASDVGARHRRDRVFLIGYLADAGCLRGELRDAGVVGGAPGPSEGQRDQRQWDGRARTASARLGSPAHRVDGAAPKQAAPRPWQRRRPPGRRSRRAATDRAREPPPSRASPAVARPSPALMARNRA